MPTRFRIWFLLVPALVASKAPHADDFDGLNEASGVNLTLDEGFGARQSAMAVAFPAFQRDADAVGNAPAFMNDVDDFTFSTSHVEKFGEAKFDHFAFLFPFEANSTLGLGLSRYGVSDIDLSPEGTDPSFASPPDVFSLADYQLVGAFARRWRGFDLGLNMNFLYRHLDQDGIGMRGDGMAAYTWNGRYRVSALMRGLVPSTVSWESGYSEYEAPEMYLGGAVRFPAPYFYGTLEAAWQSEGMFHRTARSAVELNADRAWDDPGRFFKSSNLGAEFQFDFGLAVRVGLSEFSSKSFTSVSTLGIGYNWRHVLGLDYAFIPHPDQLSSHHLSLQFTPSFPKFKGREFRYRNSPRPRPASSPTESQPDESAPEQHEGILEPESAMPAAPASEAADAPAKAASPSVQAGPAPVTKEAAPPKPAAPAQAEPAELIETDDEGQ
jgi:hypothetical protein